MLTGIMTAGITVGKVLLSLEISHRWQLPVIPAGLNEIGPRMTVVVPNDEGDAANWAERRMAVPSFLWWFHSEFRVKAPT